MCICLCQVNAMHLAVQEKAARLDYSHSHPGIAQTFSPLCSDWCQCFLSANLKSGGWGIV